MRRLAPVLAIIAIAACNNIASPARDSVYDYTLVGTDSNGVAETLVFHWPRSFLPVRVWVPDTSVLKPYVPIAIERWQDAFLYGEYRAVMVSDSAQADVIFLSSFPPTQGIESRASQCTGQTDAPDFDNMTYPLPIHIYIFPEISAADTTGLSTCYRITATHELGHSLGILHHSPFSSDIMFANPVVDSISDNDRQTVETLYHLPANVVPAGRR